MNRAWTALTIIRLVNAAEEMFANQIFNGKTFGELPETERMLVLQSIRSEISQRIAVMRDERKTIRSPR